MLYAIVLGVVAFFFISGVRIIKEFERGVILRLGKYKAPPKGPGFVWIVPGIDRMYTIDLRVVARDVPPQDVITRDNVSVKVNAVIYFRVVEPDKSVLKVENYLYATSQYAQTTLRSILGQHELDELLSNREKINQDLQEVIDRHTDVWGVKVTSVELKHVDLPADMQRAMAKQAEAERERRAKIIAADGENQASAKLAEAATTIATAPGAMTLRYLQTLAEIAVENNSVTVFPVPIDLLQGISALATHYLPAPPAQPPQPPQQPSARPSQSPQPPAVLAPGPSSGIGGGGARPFPAASPPGVKRPSVPPPPLGGHLEAIPAERPSSSAGRSSSTPGAMPPPGSTRGDGGSGTHGGN